MARESGIGNDRNDTSYDYIINELIHEKLILAGAINYYCQLIFNWDTYPDQKLIQTEFWVDYLISNLETYPEN